jgi:hypothetical protein
LEVLTLQEIDIAFPVQASGNRYTYITPCDMQETLEIHPQGRRPENVLTNLSFRRLGIILLTALKAEVLCIETQMTPRIVFMTSSFLLAYFPNFGKKEN